MYTKADFLAAVAHEVKVIKHLATCIPAGQLGYKPTPAQRSTLELLRYLSFAPLAAALYLIKGDEQSWERLGQDAEAIQGVRGFTAALAKEGRAIAALLKPLTPAKLAKTKVETWGMGKLPLGVALVGSVLQQLTAYRMQLFLYAKASGNAGIGSSDLWMGKAAKRKAAAAAG